MKATRRQELRTNTLAEQLNDIVQYIQAKSQAIIVAVVAVIAVLGVAWYWQQSAQSRRTEGWQTMLILLTTSKQQDPQVLDKMEQVAGSYGDPKLKAMAYAQLGNRLLEEASVAADAKVAQDLAQQAEKDFQTVLSQTPDQQIPAAIAQMGLATLAAGKGDFDTAKRHYEEVGNNEQLKNTPYPAQASTGLTAMEAARKLPPLAATTQPAEAATPTSQPA